MPDANNAFQAHAEEIAALKRQVEEIQKRLAELGDGATEPSSDAPTDAGASDDEASQDAVCDAKSAGEGAEALPASSSEDAPQASCADASSGAGPERLEAAVGQTVKEASDATPKTPGAFDAVAQEMPAKPSSATPTAPVPPEPPMAQQQAYSSYAASATYAAPQAAAGSAPVPPPAYAAAYAAQRQQQAQQAQAHAQQAQQAYAHHAGQQAYQQPRAQQGYAAQPQNPYGAYQQPIVRTKDHVAAGLFGIFLGMFGIHKFYLGYNTAGFIMLGVAILGGLFTIGLATSVVWLIGLIEGVIYLVKNQTEFEQTYVFSKREWF